MARGWESKSVESQQEEKSLRDALGRDPQQLTPEERERRARLESLELSRSRTLEQLERATSPARRSMLKRTLVALEKQMSELEISS